MPLILVVILSLVIWGLLFWLAYWGLGQLAIPQPFNTVIRVLLVVAAIIVVIGALSGASWALFPGILGTYTR